MLSTLTTTVIDHDVRHVEATVAAAQEAWCMAAEILVGLKLSLSVKFFE